MWLNPVLLWLWFRLAAVAPIRPLAWELPYGCGPEEKKKKRRKLGGGEFEMCPL